MTYLLNLTRTAVLATALSLGAATMSFAESAILEITLKIAPENRAAAAAVYTKYKAPFLETIAGAMSKRLLIRDDDVQVLHEFATTGEAQAYLTSPLFTDDVVTELKPLLTADPEVRIYSAD